MTNQNKINQIERWRNEAGYLRQNLEKVQKENEKIPELNQEIEYLKSQFVNGDIAGNKCRIRNLETQLRSAEKQNAENQVLLCEKDEKIAEYLDRLQNLENQLQKSQEKIKEFQLLLGQKDESHRETITYYRNEINKMSRSLDSDQKFSKILSVIIYSITMWILN